MSKAKATASSPSGPLTLELELDCQGEAGTPSQPTTTTPSPAQGTTTTPTPTGPTTTTPTPAGTPQFDINPDLLGVQFVKDSEWYKSVKDKPAHPRSAEIILSIAPVTGVPVRRTQNDWGPDFGLLYTATKPGSPSFPPVPFNIGYSGESEPGPDPFPANAPISGGENADGDRHRLHYDRNTGKLYEQFRSFQLGGGYKCDSIAVWDKEKGDQQRPNGWTSADAAGLPILPGIVRYDEFHAAMSQTDPAKQHLGHAIRYTLARTGHGYLRPANHYASTVDYSLPNRPPMGMRCRVKASLDLSAYTLAAQVLLRTLQIYGGILADNGANWFFQGTNDARWDNYWDQITANVDGKKGFKLFAGQAFEENMEIVNFDDSEVVTQS